MARSDRPVRRGARARAKSSPAEVRVQVSAGFAQDVQAQILWLKSRHDLSWVARLEEELGAARALLTRFPEAGRVGADGGDPSRRLVLKKLPLVLWYRSDGSRVIWLRLFHARRER